MLFVINIPPALAVLDVISHVQIPIGDPINTITMISLYESGTGLNTRMMIYHEHIKGMNLDLVIQFTGFDNLIFGLITIGGIYSQAWGPDLLE